MLNGNLTRGIATILAIWCLLVLFGYDDKVEKSSTVM